MLLSFSACDNTDNNINTTPQNNIEQNDTEQNSAKQEETEPDNTTEDNVSDTSNEPHGITNAVALGQTATSTFENRSGVKENSTITVNKVIRGDEALSYIQEKMGDGYWTAQNPEDETDEYLIAEITFTMNSYEDGDSKDIHSFYSTMSDGTMYPSLLAGMFYNKDTFVHLSSLNISVGETVTGYEIFLVKKDDTTPLAYYRSNYEDNSDGLWFELY